MGWEFDSESWALGFEEHRILAEDEARKQAVKAQRAEREFQLARLKQVQEFERTQEIRNLMRTITENIDEFQDHLLSLDRGRALGLPQLGMEAAFYLLTYGASLSQSATPDFVLRFLEPLCKIYLPQCLPLELALAVRDRQVICHRSGALDADTCGLFWQALIQATPPVSRPGMNFEDSPAPTNFIVESCQEMLHYFGDTNTVPSLKKAFLPHLLRHNIFHCDERYLLTAIERQSMQPFDSFLPYRDLMTTQFPEVEQLIPLESIATLEEEELLLAVYGKDPALAIAMWRYLWALSSEHQWDDRALDGVRYLTLAGYIYMRDMASAASHYLPIINTLEADETLCTYLFQSGRLGYVAQRVLVVCPLLGRTALLQRITQLMAHNPQVTPRLLAKTRNNIPSTTAEEEESLYIQVAVDGYNQLYTYRSQDRSLTLGDLVRVPFGKEERVAAIKQMGLYTPQNAPHPAEKTKFILGKSTSP